MTCAPENSNIRSVYTKKNGNDEAGENAEMKEMKWWMDIVKNLTLLTQFSFTLVTPLLMCLGLCWLLCAKAGLGGWVYIPGFFFGMGGSGMVACFRIISLPLLPSPTVEVAVWRIHHTMKNHSFTKTGGCRQYGISYKC